MIATNKRLAKTIVATLKEFKEESDDVSVFETVCLLELSDTIWTGLKFTDYGVKVAILVFGYKEAPGYLEATTKPL